MRANTLGRFTAEEERRIDESYDTLLYAYVQSKHRKKVEAIEKAFRFARDAHQGVRRHDGQPYILHSLAVARICASELRLGSTSIICALLHDIVHHSDLGMEDIRNNFGDKISSIVRGIVKISGGIFGLDVQSQAQKLRDMLMSMSTDVRVILVKMADRMHNIRNIEALRDEKKHKVAREALYVYAPLAERLGLFGMKQEFEDLAFRCENPTAYETILEKLEQTKAERDRMAEEFIAPLRRKLDMEGIRYEMKARVKSVYSIYRKMKAKGIPFEEVFDVYAVRIIFENEEDALEETLTRRIGDMVSEGHRIHPDRTRDWIFVPKDNGYRALHLTLSGPDSRWVEVQIRSRKMDDVAELGYAAHWKYKDGVRTDSERLDRLVNHVKEILENPEPKAVDFLDSLRFNLFAKKIYVLTPGGDLKGLPTGATVLDMAYAIHTEVGNHCVAGKVNRRLARPEQVLDSGDLVEVITAQCVEPEEDWLGKCVTANARNKIRRKLAITNY